MGEYAILFFFLYELLVRSACRPEDHADTFHVRSMHRVTSDHERAKGQANLLPCIITGGSIPIRHVDRLSCCIRYLYLLPLQTVVCKRVLFPMRNSSSVSGEAAIIDRHNGASTVPALRLTADTGVLVRIDISEA